MNSRVKTCCFTGHRIIPEDEYAGIQKRLENEIENLIHQGVYLFIAGGALGFDTMAAQAVIKLRTEFPHIGLILVPPHAGHTKHWHEKDQKIYGQILEQADVEMHMAEHYYDGCMQARNRYMALNSRFCICYLTKSTGGTAYTVNYAKKKGLRIINLAQSSS